MGSHSRLLQNKVLTRLRMLRQAVLYCAMGLVLGASRNIRNVRNLRNKNQLGRPDSKVINVINPSQEASVEDQQILQRFARSAQLGGYGAPPAAAAPLPLMPYRYGYAVQDADCQDFNQQEQSDGDQVTGQYSVLLPDGRVQTVTYSVRPETGYVAEVTYSDGVLCAPPPPASGPAYGAPQPAYSPGK